jgi:cell division protein FtsW (lipid II flippase)
MYAPEPAPAPAPATKPPNQQRRQLLRAALVHLAVAALCVIATLIYGLFAHDVRSWSMDLSFGFPLLAGCGVFLLLSALSRAGSRRWLDRMAFNLYNSAIATATVAAFLAGIIEIYGTTSAWPPRFYLASAILLALALIKQLAATRRSAQQL